MQRPSDDLLSVNQKTKKILKGGKATLLVYVVFKRDRCLTKDNKDFKSRFKEKKVAFLILVCLRNSKCNDRA